MLQLAILEIITVKCILMGFQEAKILIFDQEFGGFWGMRKDAWEMIIEERAKYHADQ